MRSKRGKSPWGAGADQWYYYANTETYRLEVTNCDFKSWWRQVMDLSQIVISSDSFLMPSAI